MRLSLPASPTAGRIGLRVLAFSAATLFLAPADGSAQCISLTSTGVAYTQDFNTLSNAAGTTTNALSIPGWFMTETGGGARDNELYGVDTGGSTTGDTFSYGSAAAVDRALGGLQSGTLIPVIGACFTNNTGATLSSLDVTYVGEQWRVGTVTRDDRIDFQYSLDATSLTTGAWTNVDALDYTGPQNAATGAKDGNNASFRATVSDSVSSLSIANGATFWIRWNDFNASGADDGLAVDEFSLTPQTLANQAIIPACPASLQTISGTATSGLLSATDADGTVVSAAITGITPSDPGTISITGFTPAGGIGGTATGALSVSAATPGGNYSVTVQWANNDGTPQTADCVTALSVGTEEFIHDVQGSGSATPMPGALVSIEGIVVGAFQGSTKLQGFFLQEENADADADPNTSEGIFVFCGGCPTAVTEGQRVKAIGLVSEFFNMTEVTASSAGSVIVTDAGNNLAEVTPAALSLPITGSVDAFYEPREGMLVAFADTLAVSEYFELAQFGQIILTEGGRPFQYTETKTPSAPGYAAHLLDLSRRQVILDDDTNAQNAYLSAPEGSQALFYPRANGGFGAGTQGTDYFRGGDLVNNLTGVLHWSFAGVGGSDAWRIRPTQANPVTFTVANPRPATPPAVGGAIKAVSMNLLNYFTTIDTTASNNSGTCGPGGTLDCRGADSTAELDRQRERAAVVICGLNADVYGFMELENTTASDTIDDLLLAVNNVCGGSHPYAAVSTGGTLGTDAIRVQLVYRSGILSPVGPALVDMDPVHNRPPTAQTFDVVDATNPALGQRFTVIASHFKSKGCGGATGGNVDAGDGQGCFSADRTDQAARLLTWTNGTVIPAPSGANGDPDVLLLGDFNSYAKEPPVTTLTGGGYVDVETALLGASAYSYLFDSQLGHLDYAFASTSLYPQVAGIGAWHINADEVPIFDYNDEIRDTGEAAFEEKPNGTSLIPARNVFEPATPARAADHDPILIGLFPQAPVVISPTSVVTGASTAALGGNVTSAGSSPITDRGVVYAPTATNADPLIGGPGVTQVSAGAGSTGVFNVGVTGLTPTGYSFKAYATNANGTSYTAVAAFSTVFVGPHGTPATATPLVFGPNGAVKAHGEIFPGGDVDYYSFTATAGDRVYAATMTSASVASTDSQLTLLAPDGVTEIDFDDDLGSFSGTSSSIAGAVIPSTGTYYLKVNDYLTGSGQELGYDLYVQLRTGAPVAETESNNTFATANSGSTWYSGSVGAGDQDWYAIPLAAGDTVFLSIDTDQTPLLGVGLFGAPGDPAGMFVTGFFSNFMTVKDAGTYYALVSSTTPAPGPYSLSITVLPRVAVGVNPTTYTSTDVPKTIGPGAGLVSSTITVPGQPRIASIRVTLDLNHAQTSDLDIHLRSPAGNDIGLFTDVGPPFPGLLTQMVVTFADDAAVPPPSADDQVTSLPPSVLRGLVLKPEREYRLSWLNGEDAGGTWTLDIRDDGANASGGTLNGWSLEISEMPPAPAGGVIFATDFESGDAGFTHSGTLDEWALGTPATAATTTSLPVAAFTTANSGANAWKTDLTGTYGSNSDQDLFSPNIDLTSLTGPAILSWAQKYQLGSAAFDHAFVEVQEIGGPATTRKVWEWLDGTMTDAVGNPAENIGASAGWGLMRADITDFVGKVIRVRFHLDSNTPGNLGGLAIDDVMVTAMGTPVVTTPTSASITSTSATLGGNVTSAGASPITGRGVVYALTSANSDPLRGGLGVVDIPEGGTTTGVFTVSATGLTPLEDYSFKAYATSALGTGYTPVATFAAVAGCPTITLASLPNGIVNAPYAGSAVATGGVGPYSYAVTSGALPTGFSLTPNGAGAGDVTGTSAITGVFTFEITATDANTCTGAQSYTVTMGSSIAAGDLVIRDFRWRGPLGAEDEYIEVYNPTSNELTIAALDGSAGFGIVSESIGLVVTILNGTVIPAGGSFLATNITPGTGYSLENYGGTGVAVHDASWTTDVPDGSGVGLFRSTTTFDIPTTRIDAVGFTGSAALYREGAGLAPASGITTGGEWVFTRRAPYPIGAVKDTGDNALDFHFVSTDAGIYGVQSALGAPGPLNLAAPRVVVLPAVLADPGVSKDAPPNRTQVGNYHYFRRRITNNTGAAITKLRFRVSDLSTLEGLGYNPGVQADWRGISTVDASISVPPGPIVVTARGLTLEAPSVPYSVTGKGGGYQSSFSVDLSSVGGSLAPGDSMYVNIGFRNVKGGSFYFILVTEVVN